MLTLSEFLAKQRLTPSKTRETFRNRRHNVYIKYTSKTFPMFVFVSEFFWQQEAAEV